MRAISEISSVPEPLRGPKLPVGLDADGEAAGAGFAEAGMGGLRVRTRLLEVKLFRSGDLFNTKVLPFGAILKCLVLPSPDSKNLEIVSFF